MRERLTQFGLELHPEKTRLIEFGRYAEQQRTRRGDGPPETFDFLGFTHICGKTRKGAFTIHRLTARKKSQAKLADLKKRNCSSGCTPASRKSAVVAERAPQLVPILRSAGQLRPSEPIRDAIQRMWLRTLRRRSQRGRRFAWEKFSRVCKSWLPSPKILHPYPDARFARQHSK